MRNKGGGSSPSSSEICSVAEFGNFGNITGLQRDGGLGEEEAQKIEVVLVRRLGDR